MSDKWDLMVAFAMALLIGFIIFFFYPTGFPAAFCMLNNNTNLTQHHYDCWINHYGQLAGCSYTNHSDIEAVCNSTETKMILAQNQSNFYGGKKP